MIAPKQQLKFIFCCFVWALVFPHKSLAFTTRHVSTRRHLAAIGASRIDPPESPLETSGRDQENTRKNRKLAFRSLIEQSMVLSSPDHLPGLLANNINLVMSLHGHEGAEVIQELVNEAKAEGEENFSKTVSAVETILSFAEDFVSEASLLDDHNKHVLGRIIKGMMGKSAGNREKEDLFDELMCKERENFTPGFLRHLEGECSRIANAPEMTPESTRLLETIRMIQTRVLEELGKDMGEAALVLGQLMGYEDDDELLGVLDAGLTVRGRDFALEMSTLTKEALDGFQRVPGGVDPGLVKRVSFIDSRLHDYLNDVNTFQ